jgi:hypothetical protein
MQMNAQADAKIDMRAGQPRRPDVPEISTGHLQPSAAQVKRHSDADHGATRR